MRLQTLLIGTVMIIVTTISCKKNIENSGLIGNWKLVEQYDGYANGGSFQWNKIPSENSYILSFTADGKYLKTETNNTYQNNCTGTYIFHTDNKLEISSSCNTVTEMAFVSELTSTTLILDRSGIEGIIRYKYSATK